MKNGTLKSPAPQKNYYTGLWSFWYNFHD